MTTASDVRAGYLPELVATLWPTTAGGDGQTVAYRIVPSRSRPRLIAPAGDSRAAVTAVRHAVEAVGLAARARRSVVAGLLRLGAGPLLFRDGIAAAVDDPDGIEAYLANVLGQPVLLAVHVGPPRATRKPVLTLLDATGAVAGFAKLGVNRLTKTLVSAEGAALRKLAGKDLQPILAPELLHEGEWHGHSVLVQSALPVWLPRADAASAARVEREALVRLARCAGTRPRVLADSRYADRLQAALTVLVRSGDVQTSDATVVAEADRLLAFTRKLVNDGGEIEFGAWHGDHNGGNAAVVADGRMLMWDWERYDTDVPVGFDALHAELQSAIFRRGVPPIDAARWLFRQAPQLLAPFGTVGAPSVVAGLYLVELGTRYLRDRQWAAGVALGRLGTWLLPALEESRERR